MTRSKISTSCRTVLREFSRYLDGEQSPANCRRIERHLASCASCAAATEQIRATVQSCRAMTARRLPAEIRLRAAQRIRALLDA